MGKFKKTLLIIGIVVISIFVLWTLVYNLLNYFTSDIVPINDKDLQLGKITVAKEENAYYDLIKVEDAIYWKWPDDKPGFINKHAEGEVWDAEFVQDLLEKNKQAFEYFDQAVKKSKFQDPAFDDLEKILKPEKFETTTVSVCRKIVQLSVIKAFYLNREGKSVEALEEAMKSIKIGQLIQESQLGILQYLMAISTKKCGLKAMRIIITSAELSSATLIQYSRKLDDFKKNEEGLKIMWKGEYLTFAKFIDSIASGNIEQLKQYDFTSDFSSNDFKEFLPFSKNNFYFRPNKTKLLFAEYVHSIINDAEKPYSLTKSYDVEKLIPASDRFFYPENFIGKTLFGVVASGLRSAITSKYRTDLFTSATQLLFALKAYKTETGEYPLTLNLLVPKYISNVPQDPFDGKPIRYLPEKKIIYSGGEDLIDDGGDDKSDSVFRLEF